MLCSVYYKYYAIKGHQALYFIPWGSVDETADHQLLPARKLFCHRLSQCLKNHYFIRLSVQNSKIINFAFVMHIVAM